MGVEPPMVDDSAVRPSIFAALHVPEGLLQANCCQDPVSLGRRPTGTPQRTHAHERHEQQRAQPTYYTTTSPQHGRSTKVLPFQRVMSWYTQYLADDTGTTTPYPPPLPLLPPPSP